MDFYRLWQPVQYTPAEIKWMKKFKIPKFCPSFQHTVDNRWDVNCNADLIWLAHLRWDSLHFTFFFSGTDVAIYGCENERYINIHKYGFMNIQWVWFRSKIHFSSSLGCQQSILQNYLTNLTYNLSNFLTFFQ